MDQAFYHIRVKGHLGLTWGDWFDSLAIENLPDGEADLCGSLPDQAALYAVLNRIRDVGLTLLSVSRAAARPDPAESPSRETAC